MPLTAGPAPDLNDLFELNGFEGGPEGNGSYLEAAGGGQQADESSSASVWGTAHEQLPFEEKVERLMGAFEVRRL